MDLKAFMETIRPIATEHEHGESNDSRLFRLIYQHIEPKHYASQWDIQCFSSDEMMNAMQFLNNISPLLDANDPYLGTINYALSTAVVKRQKVERAWNELNTCPICGYQGMKNLGYGKQCNKCKKTTHFIEFFDRCYKDGD